MKVYLVNDCSYWPGLEIHHAGCKAVIDSLKLRITAAGHEIVHVCPRPEGPTREKIADCDWLIVNAEGTFRDEALDHERGRIQRLREGMALAKEMGKRVYMINAVWANMRVDDYWRRFLNTLDGISAREPASQLALWLASGRPDVECHPDEAYFLPVHGAVDEPFRRCTLLGDIYEWNLSAYDRNRICDSIGEDGRILRLTKYTWPEAVRYLRKASLYIVGQHHGVYAACKARCPFVAGRVNTHKLTSLFEWAGVNIPLFNTADECLEQVRTIDERQGEFEKLFDFLERQSPWPIPAS